jgi:hypothetical protein
MRIADAERGLDVDAEPRHAREIFGSAKYL